MSLRVYLVDELGGDPEHITVHRVEPDGTAHELIQAPDAREALRAALHSLIADNATRRPSPPAGPQVLRAAGSLPEAAVLRAWWAQQPPESGLPLPRASRAIPRSVRTAYANYLNSLHAERPRTTTD
ncbi:hypothetical protein [Cryptosporangium phraense]|uniref:Lsr2 family protein n=1 Tax=Cryptosporangium phraense TaxID=2593070 RepID=A0A545ANC6_9ACTN|nr:hypothetical protein [Cryptosporangium phraense]TQS42832.1 hypothetical protein FL583_22540 [Cryptosporangium phraense]